MQAKVASGVGYGAIGGAISAFSANAIATAVTGGKGVTDPAQLAMITAATTLLSGAAAGLLGQNVYGATAAAQNETLNNACAHFCGVLAAAGAVVGGAVAAGGSVAGDVATGGANIVLTPTEVAAGSAVGGAVGGAVGSKIDDWLAAHGGAIFNSGDSNAAEGATSPTIDPADVAGKTPEEIDQVAKDNGLVPKGPDPASGRGAYVDPVTGEQRILVHPNDPCPHCHVNDPSGGRLDIHGNPVPPESPGAHLPLKTK